MGKPTVNLNLPGLNALMRSAEVQAEVNRRGQRIQAAAGENFEYVASPHRYTARGYVQVNGAAGAREEARDKRLTRSLDAGR